MSENYLIHHGILGQKWGVRRYQNPDGSLTDAGKKHYNTSLDYQVSTIGTTKKKKINSNDALNTINTVKSISKNADGISKSIGKMANNKHNKKVSSDLSNMTDEELKRRVNRMNLEQQYKKMTGADNVMRGKDYVREALEITGSIAGIAGSAALIYSSLKK